MPPLNRCNRYLLFKLFLGHDTRVQNIHLEVELVASCFVKREILTSIHHQDIIRHNTGGQVCCVYSPQANCLRSLLSFDLEALDRLATYCLYVSVGAPPAHNSGICDAAPPLTVRDLRLASNTLMVSRISQNP